VPTLNRIHVAGLLGRFEHEVEFPEDDSFVILHGPNGVGKTHLLMLIQSVLSGEFWNLYSIRFDTFSLNFSENYSLNVKRTVGTKKQIRVRRQAQVNRRVKQTVDRPTLELTLRHGREVLSVWNSDSEDQETGLNPAVRSLLEVDLGFDRFGPDEWYDTRTETIMSTDEAISRFAAMRPERYRESFSAIYRLPTPISEFLAKLPAKFVQTQRLLVANDYRVSTGARRGSLKSRQSTVVEFSQDISRIISGKLAENSRISSQLDRSFPKRVLERADDPSIKTEDLLQKYQEQSALRNKLAEVSLLDHATDIPLQDRELNTTEQRVLATYLEDAEKKLGTFKDTLDKITLLRDIINERFLYKTLRIDSSEGFVFETEGAEERETVSPDQLSSGEQHELVLLYELLFRTAPGAVVLIDEPEISLHVKWQREFINDLISVSNLSNLRFIIATHSPQIVGNWHSKSIFLAPGEDWQ